MHSVPIGCWLSEPFWQVYIVRQSFPRRSGGQAIQRSFLQQDPTPDQGKVAGPSGTAPSNDRPTQLDPGNNLLVSHPGSSQGTGTASTNTSGMLDSRDVSGRRFRQLIGGKAISCGDAFEQFVLRLLWASLKRIPL
jgi:hypothetical protein